MALGDERLGTLNESGGRMFLHPGEVKGFFRRYRTYVYLILVCIFLVVPWLKWNGLQLILLDIPNRTFIFGGFLFKAHDAPLIFLLMALATIGLAAFTAVFGRVWCGWACPQTVFIDVIYRQIEIWIQGKYIARRKLHAQNLNFEKFYKISLTWLLFIIVSFIISHSFAAYFVGSDRLIEMMQGSPEENKTIFWIIMSFTAILLFDFGWFREQFCIIACPYGRFQSVLMDNKTVSVIYDYKRGEPRRGSVPAGEPLGDCVSCRRCVEVCPTGIDIRRGIQMECIGCTACIDACDEIMTKVNKPKGLIRYTSEHEVETGTQIRLIDRLKKPRVMLYGVLILLAFASLLYIMQSRQIATITVLRKSAVPYSEVSLPDGSKQIINHVNLHLHNQSFESLTYEVQDLNPDLGVDLLLPVKSTSLKSNSSKNFPFVVRFSPSILNEKGQAPIVVRFIISGKEGEKLQIDQDITLVGPK